MINQSYFEKWSEIVKNMQAPLQAMAELNLKTFQNFTYLKPEELATLKKPEQLIEAQAKLAIDNGHKALKYMENSFKIYENIIQNILQNLKNTKSTETK